MYALCYHYYVCIQVFVLGNVPAQQFLVVFSNHAYALSPVCSIISISESSRTRISLQGTLVSIINYRCTRLRPRMSAPNQGFKTLKTVADGQNDFSMFFYDSSLTCIHIHILLVNPAQYLNKNISLLIFFCQNLIFS